MSTTTEGESKFFCSYW